LTASIAAYAMDVPFQVLQGLLYDIERHHWPTGVDMMDVIILVSRVTGVAQEVMKIGLVVATVLYLSVLALLYLWARRRQLPIRAVDAPVEV
jgi:hypothetical protein